jgi:hypothetical protein
MRLWQPAIALTLIMVTAVVPGHLLPKMGVWAITIMLNAVAIRRNLE